MQITMKTLYSCPKFTAQPGDTIDIDAKLAKQLIERRYAVRAGADPATAKRPARHPEPEPDEIDPNAGGDSGGGDGEGQGDGVEPTPVDDPPADSPTDPDPADVKPPKRTRKGGK